MKICADHWQMMRKAIDDRGMTGLVNQSGEAMLESQVAEIEGRATDKDFDPLMSMFWHWMNNALRSGGLWVMGEDPSGKNDGQYCPVCLFAEFQDDFVAEKSIGDVADQMRAYCIEKGLIPAAS